jgi:hypothetical protein
LYFTAGLSAEEHGLFGSLRPTTVSSTSLVEFADNDFFAKETQGAINVTVLRSGDSSGAVTVKYGAVPSSQVGFAGPADYTLVPGTLTFAPGETSRTFTVTLVNDGLQEPTERLRLMLSNPTGAGLGDNVATLNIEEVILFANGFE